MRASRYQIEALLAVLGAVEARRRGINIARLSREEANTIRVAAEAELKALELPGRVKIPTPPPAKFGGTGSLSE